MRALNNLPEEEEEEEEEREKEIQKMTFRANFCLLQRS